MGYVDTIQKERDIAQYGVVKYYYHYTSLSTAWAILENDSLWASHARFSNDSEELKKGMAIIAKITRQKYDQTEQGRSLIEFMKNLNASMIDCYIVCFCGSDNKLSQWRGYCRKDGVSFGFAFGNTFHYYLKDNPLLGKDEAALKKVCYINKIKADDSEYTQLNSMLENELQRKDERDIVQVKEILLAHIPLIKDPGFYEEDEYRLVVSNNNTEFPGETKTPLDSIIKYRNDKGVMRPYLNLCFGKHHDEGIIAEAYDPASVDLYLYKLDKNIEAEIKAFFPKAIPINSSTVSGRPFVLVGEDSEENQKDTLRIIEDIKTMYFAKTKKKDNVDVWFEGHMPIRTITVSPCENQEEVVESIRHYCTHEKYWLKYVKVKGSQIPYRRPKE